MLVSVAIKKEHTSWAVQRCVPAKIRYFLFTISSSNLIFYVHDSTLRFCLHRFSFLFGAFVFCLQRIFFVCSASILFSACPLWAIVAY